MNGILVPGGFGARGAEGKILAARIRARAQVPYFGICFGMQMAVIEAARSLAGMPKADSTEFGADERAGRRADDRIDARQRVPEARRRRANSAARCGLAPIAPISSPVRGSPRSTAQTEISERHRHRYEVNTAYRARLEAKGLVFAGMSPDGLLPETVEFADHPWFIGVQFHPELKSRPFEPHPLFASFIAAAKAQSRLV